MSFSAKKNKIHIIRIIELEFIQFKWQKLIKYLWSNRVLKSNAPFFSRRGKKLITLRMKFIIIQIHFHLFVTCIILI
jgi:hypothetical protein